MESLRLDDRRAVAVFAAFALGYFLSSLIRGITATLAPVLSQEFSLTAGQLGLLGGAYFLGFALLQLPLGHWLDRHGPRKVLLASLSLAVLSTFAFGLTDSFASLMLVRLAGGMGVSACLIAPLAGARLWLDARHQQRANAWMLMTGSLGLLAATLPVQWVVPSYGWRVIFFVLAALFALAMLGVARVVPDAPARTAEDAGNAARVSLWESYRPVWASYYFRHIAPLGLVNYGALVAIQTLWAGPWLTQVSGYSGSEAASGLFGVNLVMLGVFWAWGAVTPKLHMMRLSAERLMLIGLPLNVLSLAALAWLGAPVGWWGVMLFCALSSFLALTHPAVGAAFPAQIAGRAISAFNLLLFVGVFACQWMVGLGTDWLVAHGWQTAEAMPTMFLVLALCSALAYLWFAHGVLRTRPAVQAEPLGGSGG